MSIDLDFFGRTEEVARPIAHSLSTNRRGGEDEAGGTDKGLFLSYALSATFWGWVEKVGGWVSESDRTTSRNA
jgi:hypothetical protein